MSLFMRSMLLVSAFIVAFSAAASAREAVLQHDNGSFDMLEQLELHAPEVRFRAVEDWQHNFSEQLDVYCETYGDVSDLSGVVVIWGPQTSKTATIEEKPDSYVIHGRSFFKLSDLPAKAGWASIPLEVTELPSKFTVVVYTYSNAERGVRFGLCTPTANVSQSGTEMTGEKIQGRETKWRKDKREWMMRIKVRETLSPSTALKTSDLTGPDFSYYDDGSAEGFITTQRFGPMLRFSNSGKKQVSGVYVHAKLEGDWFGTTRNAGIYLLTTEFKIIKRVDLPFSLYTPEASWNYVSLNDVDVPSEFYVVVEPQSRPEVKFLIGYDSSGPNKASSFGTPGAPKPWMTDAPEDMANWMIRVEYK